MSPIINLGKGKKRERTINKQLLQDIYRDKRWLRVRKIKFRDNPLCERCLLDDIVTVTQEVHHIIPIDIYHLDEELAFGLENLKSLCIAHHIDEHSRLRRNSR